MTKDNLERLTSLLDANAERTVKDLLESLGVIVRKRGVVAEIDSEKSCMYANRTGESLSVGDIVYIFCQYNKDAQG